MLGELRLSRPVGLVLGLCVVILIVFRFSYAEAGFSFDYQFYIDFFASTKSASFRELVEATSETFPYTYWGGETVSFEFGFSFLSYLLTKIFSPSATYTVIALLSLSFKLYIFSRTKLNILYVLPLFIYAGVLLEGNALRAAVATSFLMWSSWLFYEGKLKSALIAMMIASTMHISSLVFLLGFIGAYFFHILRLYYTGILLTFSVTTVIVVNLEVILVFAGGKLGEYAAQTAKGMYVGASGFNAQSLLAISFFVIIQFCSLKDAKIVETGKEKFIWLYFSIITICLFALIAFSGVFSIFGDRLWQMAYFVVLVYVAVLWQKADRTRRFRKLSIARLYLFLGLGCVFYFLAFSLLFRYPQTNLASFFIGWKYYSYLNVL
jgi:hypothetical protein